MHCQKRTCVDHVLWLKVVRETLKRPWGQFFKTCVGANYSVGANFSIGAILRRREIFCRREIFRRRENSFKKLASEVWLTRQFRKFEPKTNLKVLFGLKMNLKNQFYDFRATISVTKRSIKSSDSKRPHLRTCLRPVYSESNVSDAE
jgi:hypothetical protein